MVIASRQDMEAAALRFGMLPFFANNIPGFSIEEMAAPGMLFGLRDDKDGCWEWKGPVIRERTTAYGKFFRRKAGFVALELLPDFLNYRRHTYPVKPDSTDEMLLDVIRENEGITSTDLKRLIFGTPNRKRQAEDPVNIMDEYVPPKRHGLEGPLQRLQMGGRLLITDFVYKRTAGGRRYGWGVARYATPEVWFEQSFECPRTPQESFVYLVDYLSKKLRGVSRSRIEYLIR